jgi:hypothetical protein
MAARFSIRTPQATVAILLEALPVDLHINAGNYLVHAVF